MTTCVGKQLTGLGLVNYFKSSLTDTLIFLSKKKEILLAVCIRKGDFWLLSSSDGSDAFNG